MCENAKERWSAQSVCHSQKESAICHLHILVLVRIHEKNSQHTFHKLSGGAKLTSKSFEVRVLSAKQLHVAWARLYVLHVAL